MRNITLVENKTIKVKNKTKELFEQLDAYSLKAKNLKNATNYIIKQCSRISYKLKMGEPLDSWEKAIIYKVNVGICKYNKDKKHSLSYIDNNNGFIANAYFLFYYLKDTEEYKAIYSTSAQIIISEVCQEWNSFFAAMKSYKASPFLFSGKPHTPGYLDPTIGRAWFSFTNQNIRTKDGIVKLPKKTGFDDFIIKTNKQNIKQVRLLANKDRVRVSIIYETPDTEPIKDNGRYIGIDLGINNLTTVVSNTEMTPFIINGKPLKSINQYYNKSMAKEQSQHKPGTPYITDRISSLINKRNNKINDYMHKASKMLIDIAKKHNICKIVIGNNKGWKQNADMGKKSNQNFVGIPFYKLLQMIKYKAQMAGIEVAIVEESYTSGTSYIDKEEPIKSNYNKKRRVKRGLFVSNNGIAINADVNGLNNSY